MDETRNLTLSLPARLLRRAKVVAAERGTSVSAIVRRSLEDLVEREDGYDDARRRAVARMENAPDLGTGGTITWTRDSLHER